MISIIFDREDWRAHEILMNIQSGEPCEIWEKDSYGNPKFRMPNPKRQTYPSHEYYFKSPAANGKTFFKIFRKLFLKRLEDRRTMCMSKLISKQNIIPFIFLPVLKGQSYTKEEQEQSSGKISLATMRRGNSEALYSGTIGKS